MFHIEREKYRQRLIYNSILKYSTPFIPPTFSNTYQVSIKLDSIAICHNNFTKARWFLLDRRDLLAGSYFKFAGDLQESSSRGKSWGMAFACFPIDRRDRYRKSWRCETERPTTLDPRQCKILFFPYPFFSPPSPLLTLLSSFFFSFPFSRVRFADRSIEPLVRCTRERDEDGGSFERKREREKERWFQEVERGSDGRWSHDFCLPEEADD